MNYLKISMIILSNNDINMQNYVILNAHQYLSSFDEIIIISNIHNLLKAFKTISCQSILHQFPK